MKPIQFRTQVGLFGLFALFFQPAIQAWTTDTGGEGMLWRRDEVVLHLQLGDDVTYSDGTTPNSTALIAMEEWNPLMDRVQFAEWINSGARTRLGNDRNNVYFDTDVEGEPFGPGFLAITSIRFRDNRRWETDVVVNSNLDWDSYRGFQSSPLDLRRVLVHEFGHVLGLGHPDEVGQFVPAVMLSFTNQFEVPQSDDRDGIGTLYGFTETNPERPPVFLLQPFDATVEEDLDHVLDVVVEGTTPLELQWYKDGTVVEGATSELFLILDASSADTGDYHVTATNMFGTTTSDVARVTIVPPTRPTVSATIPDTEIIVGTNEFFIAEVEGSFPITYQWFKDGEPLADADSRFFSIRDATLEDGGSYHFTATNRVSNVTSPSFEVSLAPRPAPVLLSQPFEQTSYTLQPGDSFRRTVNLASDFGDLSYQWYRNGLRLDGAINRSLEVPYGVQTPGDYHVVITNETGSFTSDTYHVSQDTAGRPTDPVAAVEPTAIDHVADEVLVDRNGDLILFSRLHRSLFGWSVRERRFSHNIPLFGGPRYITYSPVQHRVYLGYADGRITQVSLDSLNPEESDFVESTSGLAGLVATGEVLTEIRASGGGAEYLTWTADASPVAHRSYTYTWDETTRRLYHYSDFTTDNAIVSLEVRADGSIGEEDSADYTGDWTALPAPVVSGDGASVLLGTGEIRSAEDLAITQTLPSTAESAVWVGSRLYTTKTNFDGVEIRRWATGSSTPEAIAMLPGYGAKLFASPDNQLIATSRHDGKLVISILNQDLKFKSQSTHDRVGNGKLVNLSTRVNIGDAGGDLLIAGFVIKGSQPLEVLIRAVGPGLAEFGIAGTLPDPSIQLFDANRQVIGQNDDWSSAGEVQTAELSATFGSLGAFQLLEGSRDAAILTTLAPGGYTAQVARGDGPGGTVLLEVYDNSAPDNNSFLVNLSTRSHASSGDAALIVGFVVEGESQQQLLVRAAGPSLAQFGLNRFLRDPRLTVRDTVSTIGQNNDWGGDFPLTTVTDIVGGFEFESPSSADSMLLIDLHPGSYTAQIDSAVGNEEGEALVEVYQIEN